MCLCRAQTECRQPIHTRKLIQVRLPFSEKSNLIVLIKIRKCCASSTVGSNTVSLLALKQATTYSAISLIFHLKPATWFHLKPMVASRGD